MGPDATELTHADHVLRSTPLLSPLVAVVCAYLESSPDDWLLVVFPPWTTAHVVDRWRWPYDGAGACSSTACLPLRGHSQVLRFTLEGDPTDRSSFVVASTETSGLELLVLWTLASPSCSPSKAGTNRGGSRQTISLAPYPASHRIEFPFTDGRGRLYRPHGTARLIQRWTGGLQWETHAVAPPLDRLFGLNWERNAVRYRSHFAGCTVFLRHDTGALCCWNPTTGAARAYDTPVPPPYKHNAFMHLAADGTLLVLSCSRPRVWRTRLAARPDDDIRDRDRDRAACIAVCDPWTSDTVEGVPLPGTSFSDVAWYPARGRLPDGRVFFGNQYGFVCQNGARSEWRFVHGNVLSVALTGDTDNFAHNGTFLV